MTRYHAELAWVGGEVAADVGLTVEDGRFAAVDIGASAAGARRLTGLTLPGLANAHSHAFHRALRGRTQTGGGSFWTWREQMYAVARRLDPDGYRALARATFAEMALAGITCVGEFHYLHNAPDGRAYDDPNAMGAALLEAAREAGIRMTLLDTCYLTADVDGSPLAGPQLRFTDGDAASWADRVSGVHCPRGTRLGAAIHSVRAVPIDDMTGVVAYASAHELPLHLHLSEQPAENDACRGVHGRTPARLAHDLGVLGPRTTAVHATHLTDDDLALLGGSGTGACLCPTTERDLADGIGPARRLADGGSPLSLGSDSHAVIDMFEEARAVELDERLATGRRGSFSAAELLDAATIGGHQSLGWADAGVLTPGARADLVTVSLDSVRLAGTAPAVAGESVVFAATAADVRHVVIDGRQVVCDGEHLLVGDVGCALAAAITPLWTDA